MSGKSLDIIEKWCVSSFESMHLASQSKVLQEIEKAGFFVVLPVGRLLRLSQETGSAFYRDLARRGARKAKADCGLVECQAEWNR
ncbi:hypothetical protein [Methylococcus sp. Mc7]|uniref:hypothetical protein n=1 Tax=Methylococcus sp. Mc7 TaxID=2860258 RepID=UPI001C52EEA9|nr:hypothetical protein [Methylococcus sp. Mc7]QXP85470.1 hypothetical protein KW115_07100 [Methylococcus sp. Mc7]